MEQPRPRIRGTLFPFAARHGFDLPFGYLHTYLPGATFWCVVSRGFGVSSLLVFFLWALTVCFGLF